MPNDHTAIAERMKERSKTLYDTLDAKLMAEGAEALAQCADEVEQLRQAHRDADEQWGLASRAHQKAEADLASARKALGACRTSIAGYHLRYGDDAKELVDEFFNELQRIDKVAREALRASTIGEEGEGSACTDLSALSSSAPQAQHSDGDAG